MSCVKLTLSMLWRPFRHIFSSLTNFTASLFVVLAILMTLVAFLTITSANNLRVYVEQDPSKTRSIASSALIYADGRRNFQSSDDYVKINNATNAKAANGQFEIAASILKKVKVLCFVITCEKNLLTKAAAVKKTWAKRCDKTIFISEKSEPSFPAITLPGVLPGYGKLWSKTHSAFLLAYEQYADSFDWFMKADDDTYVIVENLKLFLAEYSPFKPYYFGKRFKPYGEYMSGGGGYVISREALLRVGVALKKNDGKICSESSSGGSEDVIMGNCLKKVGVPCSDSLDKDSERFHPFNLGYEFNSDLPDWYYKYSYHPIKKGFNCCSNYSITFHYITPGQMRVLEFAVYHLKAFGVEAVKSVPLNEAYTSRPLPSNLNETSAKTANTSSTVEK